MFKKFTLVVLMGTILMSAGSLSAQNDATIAPEDIQYWVGEGENEVVVAISWCSNTETALAWGYRFSGNATVFQALTDIATADSRLTVTGSAPTNITYVDDEYNLTMCPNPNASYGDDDYDVPMHSVNGLMGQNPMSSEPIQDNDFVKIGGLACAVMASDWSTISWTTVIIPATDPNAGGEVVDATISAEEILYWVGEGENEVVVAISWCSNTETALAWGYRFSGNATVFQALTDIAVADSRLTVTGSAPTNITYVDDEYNLTMCPNPNAAYGDDDYDVPMHSVNGLMGQNPMSSEPIQDNDFVKIGGLACAVVSADWSTISWEQPIEPASVVTPGVNENQFNSLAVYPNPATSSFNVNLAEVEGDVEIQVVDVQGRVLSTRESQNNAIVTMSTENMAEGMYFVLVKSSTANFVNKLIVK